MPRAEEHYRAVKDAGTQLAEAHRAFGLALLAAGDMTRAEAVLTEAVAGNPLDAESLNGLGLIQERQRRLADAEVSYRRAVAANPRLRGLRFNHARSLVGLGRLDDALAQLTLLASPDDAESARYVYAASAVAVRTGDVALGRRLGEDALSRARRHGLTDLAATIERELQKLR
jgi:type IV pilus assembly protein PilF